ncbi:peroxidase family protein [Actinomadura rudentiformis]|uniref:Heme peroxidase n=1 Tax=Actinomadura rudentiformis TaxID=359158 RepID=A0A6H9ZA03_9ACTN|nr:peroxidase family protein [Actinomadura rudentiformis]KAB2352535.1 heme peroxidase [Actinomadura rudentiformis]
MARRIPLAANLKSLFDRGAHLADRTIGWHRLPKPLGLLVLVGLRDILRRENLHDTSKLPATDLPPVPSPTAESRMARTADGSHNDPDDPRMGMAGARFGRNIPNDRTFPEVPPRIMSPSPREVSRELLTRESLIPATSVNVLVAAWLQFMIRDWFSHGRSPTDRPWEIPLADGDPWPERPMRVMRTRPDPAGNPSPSTPPTWANTETHWWDASQIYGSTPDHQKIVRSGEDGKLRVASDGLPVMPDDPNLDPRRVPGFWLGVLMMHALFTLEHNAICDRLRGEFPNWSDEELYQRARLVNAALIAKIHTVEWTPAVIAHPTTRYGMRANWWGVAGERLHKLFGRIGDGELVSGIPGSHTDHFGVPFALTEEFVAVYRMHPLVPDEFHLRSSSDDNPLLDATLRELTGDPAVETARKYGMTDLLYSFGTEHPGLVTLRNFPRFLQEFQRPDGHVQDLAATDILRVRELGVPRYNEFRRLLRLAPARSFEDLTDDPELAERIRTVYDGDIERVDLMIGMYAEKRPKGFAFSDTAFRIFILMASRRLNSDRFFTTDYTPEIYTRAGLDWINEATMTSVLLRHHPSLRHVLRRVPNAFTPWPRS